MSLRSREHGQSSRDLGRVAAVIAILALVWSGRLYSTVWSADDEPQSNNAAQKLKLRAETLQKLRARAQAMTVVIGDDADTETVKLMEQPLLRYDDQPRGILDGTLWAWGERVWNNVLVL